MTCQEFLEGYSDYLDNELDDVSLARWRQHIDACSSCRRYDDVVRRGLSLVRELPEIQPSPDFESKLHRRIWGMEMDDDVDSDPGSSVGKIAGLAIAAMLALIAWSPLVWHDVAPVSPGVAGMPAESGETEQVAEATGESPARTATSAFTSVADAIGVAAVDPESTTQWQLYSDGDAVAVAAPAADLTVATADTARGEVALDPADVVAEPGPYSPLIVGPPVFQSQRRPGSGVTAVSASPFD